LEGVTPTTIDGDRKGSAPVDSLLAMTRADLTMETVDDPAAVGFADPS
jgi:hypothetical protein